MQPAPRLAPAAAGAPGAVAPASQSAESALGPWLRRLVSEGQVDLAFVAFCLYLMVAISNFAKIGDIAMIVALVGLLFAKGRRTLPVPVVLLGCFVAWGFVGLATTELPEVVERSLEAYTKIFLIILVAANVLNSPGRVRLFVIVLLALYAYYPVRGALFSYFIYHAAELGRIAWNYTFSNPNDLAALLFLPLGLASGILASERQRFIRFAALGGAILIPLVIFLTQSRGALLGLAAFWLMMLPRLRIRWTTVVGLALGAAVVVSLAPEGVWSRIANLTKATDTSNLSALDDQGSAAQRYELWRVGRRIIRDHAVTGTGLGAYPITHWTYARVGAQTQQNSRIAGGPRDVHSTFLHVTAEAGFPGAALFFGIFLWVGVFAERVRRRLRPIAPAAAAEIFALEAATVGFFVAAIFGSFTMLMFTYLQGIMLWAIANAHRARFLTSYAAHAPVRAPARRTLRSA